MLFIKKIMKRIRPPIILTLDSVCHLQGLRDELRDKVKAELTFKNPAYERAFQTGRNARFIPKHIKCYSEFGTDLVIPRGHTPVILNMINTDTSRLVKIVDNRITHPNIEFTFKGKLRKYQRIARREMLATDFGVLEAGTGSGKTVMALAIIVSRKQPTLIVVHAKELLYQWQKRIKQFLDVDCGLYGDGNKVLKPITVGIINTLKNNPQILDSFGQIITDETHRCPSKTYTKVVSKFKGKFSLGLSATPYRRDGLTKLIHFYVGNVEHTVNHKMLEMEGAVLVPKYMQKKTKFFFNYKDNYSEMMKELCADDKRNRKIVNDIKVVFRTTKKTILIVSDRISHCKEIKKKLNWYDIDCKLLTGQLKDKDRTELVEQILLNKVRIIISTTQLIGEGFDSPDLEALFLTTPIAFEGRLKQIIGRILRPKKGKKPVVYDYVDEYVPVLAKSGLKRRKLYVK